MKTIYAAKLGIALGMWFIVGMFFPFGGFFAEPLVWMLVGNFWQVLFFVDTVHAFAIMGTFGLYAVPDLTTFTASFRTEIIPVSYLPVLMVIFVVLGVVAVLLVTSTMAVKVIGPWLERKAKSYLGYMPRNL